MLNGPDLDRAFVALGDPVRRGLLARLSLGPATVSELAEPLSITLPAVMQHLATLESGGLVRSAKQGRVRTVHLEPEGLGAAQAWIAERRSEWEAHADRLEAYLTTLKRSGES
jgi:DNA-binding transcriptional ArsR family regulator